MNTYEVIVSWKSLRFQCKSPRGVKGPLCFCIRFTTVSSSICRYQPENPVVAYEMASTQDEAEALDKEMSADDQFTIKNLLCTSNTEPSQQSGFVVNICTSALGQ